jgi:hypothetical protein
MSISPVFIVANAWQKSERNEAGEGCLIELFYRMNQMIHGLHQLDQNFVNNHLFVLKL